MMKSKLPKKVLIIAGITLLVGVGVGVVALAVSTPPAYQIYTFENNPGIMAGAPVSYWIPQNDQFSVKNTAGSFEIKAYVISGHKFYLFYVLQTGQPGLPQIAAFSSADHGYTPLPKPDAPTLPPNPTPDLKKATSLPIDSNKVIATFDKTDIGLVMLEVPDRPDQLVTFRITSPGNPQTPWELAPLQQINPVGDSQIELGGSDLQNYYKESLTYSDIRVDFPIFGGDENQLGVLKIFNSSPATPPLYFQMDSQGNLSRFTQADCAKLFPPLPTNPPRQDSGPVTATIAVPAPCNGNS